MRSLAAVAGRTAAVAVADAHPELGDGREAHAAHRLHGLRRTVLDRTRTRYVVGLVVDVRAVDLLAERHVRPAVEHERVPADVDEFGRGVATRRLRRDEQQEAERLIHDPLGLDDLLVFSQSAEAHLELMVLANARRQPTPQITFEKALVGQFDDRRIDCCGGCHPIPPLVTARRDALLFYIIQE